MYFAMVSLGERNFLLYGSINRGNKLADIKVRKQIGRANQAVRFYT